MNFKYTWAGEIASVLVSHLSVAMFISILWIIMLNIIETKIGGAIFTAFSVIIYIVFLFGAGNKVYKNDKKSYTKLSPIWYKGAILPIAVIVANIVFAIAFNLIWKNYGSEEGLSSIWAVIVNVICNFWFSPYQKLFDMNRAGIAFYDYLLSTAVPLVACFFGYYFGYKNIDVTKKLGFLMYEKKKKRV